MFDNTGDARDAVQRALTTADLAKFRDQLAQLSTDLDDPEKIEQISLLESIKSTAAAAQARTTAAFDTSQRAEQKATGVPARRLGQGIPAQVGLARRESPARAARYTFWARVLVEELPATFAVLQRGQTSEWRALLVARETNWLTPEQRALVDAEIAGKLAGLGDRQVENETKRLAYQQDPAGFVARSRAAAKDRRVTLRPAPDTMTRLTALLPVAQGVAAYAALKTAADTARASGDPRGRGQVMADTLVQRVTGQSTADAVPVEITLVMTDHTLFDHSAENADPDTTDDTPMDATNGPDGNGADGPDGSDPARTAGSDGTNATGTDTAVTDSAGSRDNSAVLVGYGPIPAGIARDLANPPGDTDVSIRRLFTDPVTGHLTAIDKRRRRFNRKQRRAIIIRDQICRTPWCGAPIRHSDHARSVAEGGDTTFENGQGLCEACNYNKQAPGWTTRAGPGGTSESVIITTPTRHVYESRPPDLPGASHGRHRPHQRAGPTRLMRDGAKR